MTETIQAITGTGDGRESKGFTPGRKVKAFIWVVLATIAVMVVATKIGATAEVSKYAMYVVGSAGLFTIGGQALVDTFAKIAAGYAVSKTGTTDGK